MVDNRAATDLYLERMLRARRTVLLAGAVLAGLLFFLILDYQLFLLAYRGKTVVWFAVFGTVVFILAGLLSTCYYLFRAALLEGGVRYAIGHVVLCIALSSQFLIGIIAIPLLVQRDIERWRRSEAEPPLAEVVGWDKKP